jgi:hypothetical protein
MILTVALLANYTDNCARTVVAAVEPSYADIKEEHMMSESHLPNVEARNPEDMDRKPWLPLGFEKISVADAESGFIGTGADNSFYS